MKSEFCQPLLYRHDENLFRSILPATPVIDLLPFETYVYTFHLLFYQVVTRQSLEGPMLRC